MMDHAASQRAVHTTTPGSPLLPPAPHRGFRLLVLPLVGALVLAMLALSPLSSAAARGPVADLFRGGGGRITIQSTTGGGTVTLAPTAAPAGALVSARGDGFTPGGQPLPITWDGTVTRIGLALPAPDGTFLATFPLPADAAPGTHTITIGSVITSFTIAPTTTGTLPEDAPAVSVSPRAGPAGAALTASGTQLGEEQAVQAWWTTSLQSLSGTNVSTDVDGVFGGLNVTAPGSLAPGIYGLTVSGGTSGRSATTTFVQGVGVELQPHTTAAALDLLAPTMTVVAHTGTQPVDGIEVHLRFDPSLLEVVDVDPATQGVQVTPGTAFEHVLQAQADNAAGVLDLAYGRGETQDPLSGTLTLGTFQWKGKGVGVTSVTLIHAETALNSEPYPMTVPPLWIIVGNATSGGAVTLAPSSAPAGSLVAARGTGFAAQGGQPLPITWDGPNQRIGLALPASNGTFLATFAIPRDAAPGTHTVTIGPVVVPFIVGPTVQGTFPAEAPTLTITPDAGPVGTSVIAAGTLLGTSQPVHVWWPTTMQILSTGAATTDPLGALTGLNVATPTGTAPGAYPVTVIGGTSGRSATATLVQGVGLEGLPATVGVGLEQTSAFVSLVVRSGMQPVDGLDLHLSFNPDLVEIVDGSADHPGVQLTLGPNFPVVLQHQIDNVAGTIRLALGRAQDVAPPAGTLEVARFQVRGKQPGIMAFTATRSEIAFASQLYTVVPGLPQVVVAAPATQLAFLTQPGDGVKDVVWVQQPAVEILDAAGDRVAASRPVTLSITPDSGPADAQLTCTNTTVTSATGIATFAGCKINLAGTYTLTATSDGLTAAVSSAFTIQTPQLSVNPTQGAPGAQVQALGVGFLPSPSQPVVLTWDDVAQTVLGNVNTNANGAFSTFIQIPNSATDDTHTITATQGAVQATATFKVERSRAITLSLVKGPAGTDLTVNGVAFLPGPVTVRWDDQAQTVLATATADGDGAFSVGITIPTTSQPAGVVTPVGGHTITAADSIGNASYNFLVTAPPSLQLDRLGGLAGTQVQVNGAGFAAGRTVTLQWDQPPQTLTIVPGSGSLTTSVSGAFQVSITIPDAASGRRTITAIQTGTTAQASATLTVMIPVNLRGRVVFTDATPNDLRDNPPVPGARGWANQPSAPGGEPGFETFWTDNNGNGVTDAGDTDGNFEILVLPGSYNVGVLPTGASGQVLKVLTTEVGVSLNQAGAQTPGLTFVEGGQNVVRVVFVVGLPDISISGRVFGSDSTTPIGDATVTLTEVDAGGNFLSIGGQTRTLATTGEFSFQVPTGKRWKLGAYVTNAGPITPVDVNNRNPVVNSLQVNLSLPTTATLVGAVRINGVGIPAVAVAAQASSASSGGSSTVTTAGGGYTLPLARPTAGSAAYPVSMWSPQTGQVTARVVVDSFGNITCEAAAANTNCTGAGVSLSAQGLTFIFTTANITVTLVDDGGAALPAADLREVSVQATSTTAPGNTITARTTNPVSLPLLAGGHFYTLAINVSGYGAFACPGPRCAGVAIGPTGVPAPASVTLSLPTQVTITGRVTDSAGNGLEGAVINVVGLTNATFGVTTTTCSTATSANCAQDGDYRVQVPSNAAHSIIAAKAGYIPSGLVRLAVGTGVPFTCQNAVVGTACVTAGMTIQALDYELDPISTVQQVQGDLAGTDAEVTVTAVRASDQLTLVTTSGQSRDDCPAATTQFCLNLPVGTWQIRGRSNGFETTDTNTLEVDFAIVTPGVILPAGTLTLTPIDGFQSREPQTQQVGLNESATIVDSVNGATVQVPSGALGGGEGSASITTRQTTDISVPGGVGIPGGRAIQVDIRDEQGRRITNFSQPLTITIDYSDLVPDPLSVAEAQDLRCARFDTTANAWLTVPYTNDTVNFVLTCYTDRLTKFTVLSTPSVSSPPPSGGGGGGGGTSPIGSSGPLIGAAPPPFTLPPLGLIGPNGQPLTTVDGRPLTNYAPPGSITAILTAATGGPVRLGNVATLTLPPNAATVGSLTTRMAYALPGHERPLPLQGFAAGVAAFTVELTATGTPVAQLTKAAQLAVSYHSFDLDLVAGDVTRLKIYRYDETEKTWLPLETTVDEVNRVLKADTDRPGLYAVLADLPAPTDPVGPQGGVVHGLETDLAWTSPLKTAQYQVQIIPFNNDGPAINLIIGRTDLVGQSGYHVPAPYLGRGNYIMLPGMTYTWRVRTTPLVTPLTESHPSWSGWIEGTFRTAAPTSSTISPVHPLPEGTTTSLTPLLEWANVNPNIFYYEVQLSADPKFEADPAKAIAAVYWNLIHVGETATQNTWAVPEAYQLKPGTTYYWRVRPRVQGDGVPVAWSPSWWFQTP